MSAAAQSPTDSRLTVLSSNSQEIVLELIVADFAMEPVDIGGQPYQQLVIPRTTQTETPGAPQVPTRGAMLGLPTTKGVAVEILEADTETLDGFRLPPTPAAVDDSLLDGGITIEQIVQDQAIYRRDAFYPDSPVSLGQPALLRDQPVVGVHFYLVRYNTVSGQIRLVRRLVVVVPHYADRPN